LADSGISKIQLKRAGRWKSDTVCDRYIEESSSSKLQIAKAISSSSVGPSSAQNVKNVTISGVTGNIYLNI
jgi:hypothetical protein